MRRAWAFLLVLVLVVAPFASFSSSAWGADPTDPSEFFELDEQHRAAAERLANLSDEQREIVNQLFELNLALEEANLALAEALVAIEEVEASIVETQERQASYADELAERQELLGMRVRWLYEEGEATLLDLILSSQSLGELIWRLDVVNEILELDRSIAASARSLWAQAVADEELLLAQRAELEAAIVLAEERQVELEEAVASREAALAALDDERGFYEGELAALEDVWIAGALPVLLELRDRGARLIDADEFRPDELDIRLFPPSGRVRVTDKTLNEYLLGTDLRAFQFHFGPVQSRLTGEYSGLPVELAGQFSLDESGTLLLFTPAELYFGGVRIPPRVLASLWGEAGLELDLSMLISPLRLTELKALEGALELRAGL